MTKPRLSSAAGDHRYGENLMSIYKPVPGLFLGLQIPPLMAVEFETKAQNFFSLFNPSNAFFADNLFTCGKTLEFLRNPRFREIVDRNAVEENEQTMIWRTYVLCWAAKTSLGLAGDFVEIGCHAGYFARCIAEFTDFANTGKEFYLYDVFDHPSQPEGTSGHGPDPFDVVKDRFADHPNVKVTRGLIPDILETVAPEKIAFMHIDMNSVSAEIGALERLFDRVTPGGIIVFDDYGYAAYVAQKEAEDEFMADRDHMILELPTGQGLVLKG